MRIAVLLVAFLWGIGQNTPFEWLYVAGIGPGDLLFLGLLTATLSLDESRREFLDEAYRLRNLLQLLLVFVALTGISSLANVAEWGFSAKDVVEIFRPLYYFLMLTFVAINVRRYGESVVVAFLGGILLTGVIAYLMPSQSDVLGLLVLWNPNVMGNMLAIGVVIVSLLIVRGRLLAAAAFLFAFMVLSVFTYSKGTWLMVFLGLVACLIALQTGAGGGSQRNVRLLGKAILGFTVIGLVALVVTFFDVLYEFVAFKIATTQLDSSAAEGGTAAARWGFVLASVRLAAENPFLGVGISNYERAYDTLADWLGSNYWPTDNPHSAWLYILACIGAPALVVFLMMIYNVLQRYRRLLPMPPRTAGVYLGLVSLILLLSGAVILHILTQYYFWFIAGTIYGLRPAGPELGRLPT
jgi:hypothetical protein